MQLEAKCHEFAYFATLTYRPEDLPPGGTLVRADMAGFLKRFRARLDYERPGARVRFSGCGEYGSGDGKRPHYHLLLYLGATPLERLQPWRRTDSGELTYRSTLVEEAWGKGHVELGAVTPASCDYVAGYTLKKQHRGTAADYLRRHDDRTGETWQVAPEFSRHSTHPGIGALWFQKWPEDVIGSGGEFAITLPGGVHRTVPGYFLRLLKRSSDRVARGLPPLPGLEVYAGAEDIIAKAREQRAGERTLRDLARVDGCREKLAAMHVSERERIAEYREHMLRAREFKRATSGDVL